MIYRFMRTLILEKAEEITYNVPFSRSFNVLTDGFSTREIDEIRSLLSGGEQKNYISLICCRQAKIVRFGRGGLGWCAG